MSNEESEADVRQFYADATLPEDRVDAILAHGHSVADARFWKRVAGTTALGLVAMTIACVTLLIRSGGQSDRPVAPMIAGDPVGREGSVPTDESRIDASRQIVRLVAVRSHGDRCPHCRNSSQRFAELKAAFDGSPIEFTMIDLRRNAENLEESKQKFDAFRLGQFVPGNDKALIAISDGAGNFRRLDDSMSTDQMKQEITGLLGIK